MSARILVVDDSSTIRRILAQRLQGAGHVVTEAADGQAGMDACRADRPDLVLLDIDMAGLDGRETLRAMKADPELREIPVLFLTAHSGGADVALGLELGAQDYIRKPCEPAELLARVDTALRMDSMQRQLREQAAQLEALSSTDPLTALGNRRRFEQQVVTLMADDAPLGFVLLDVDHFKRINDEEGHAIGDVVLRILAQRLQGLARDTDVVLRWGGEEFLVIAPGVTDERLKGFAERVRTRVESPHFVVGEGRSIPVTVSVGCVSAPARQWEAAIAAADVAMYQVKHDGRNGVRVGELGG